MAQQIDTSARAEHVGRTGIYPASGPPAPAGAVVRGQGELAHPEERLRRRTARTRWPGNASLLAVGRALLGGYFLYNGINHFRNTKMLADYARSKQVPLPEVGVITSGALIALGGLSIITGARPKVGASLIATFLLGVSPIMHKFWDVDDEALRMNDFVNFTKNMALLGGACVVAALPEPWPASVRVPSAAVMERVNDRGVAPSEQLMR